MGVAQLLLVRHGESQGNLAAAAAERAGLEVIDIDLRDADVPLSGTGTEQAKKLGQALADLPQRHRPDLAWTSPYVRAAQTAQIAIDASGLGLELRIDERLRDRELGVLDRLTRRGVTARHPLEEELRRRLGKFYHRPSGGESWADVALRVRSWLDTLDEEADARRVLVVCHDAVVMLIRYACERLTEAEVLDIARGQGVRNVSLTRLQRADDGSWRLAVFDDVGHLEEEPVPVTHHPGDRHG